MFQNQFKIFKDVEENEERNVCSGLREVKFEIKRKIQNEKLLDVDEKVSEKISELQRLKKTLKNLKSETTK